MIGPSTALYRSFLTHCTLTDKAMGTMWRDLSKPPQRRQGPDPRPVWLVVGTPLILGPALASRRAEHSHSGGCLIYFWYTVFILNLLSSDSVLWQKPLHQQKCQKGKVTTQTTPQKSSIKQRLRTDLGRSVGVTKATQLVWLTGLRAHLPTNRNSRLIKRTHV